MTLCLTLGNKKSSDGCFDKTAATLNGSDQVQYTQKGCGLCCKISYVEIEMKYCIGRIIKVVVFGFGRVLKVLLP